MRKYIAFILAGLLSLPVSASVVVGGSRFVFYEGSNSMEITLQNPDDQAYLINTKILSPDVWLGEKTPTVPNPFIVSPPLFLLKPHKESKVRLIRNDSSLPKDRESLFQISFAMIPSGKVLPSHVKMAVRMHYKIVWRPLGLKGIPDEAYQQLKWKRKDGKLVVTNPTPRFVSLLKVTVNDKPALPAGTLMPFGELVVPGCKSNDRCHISWQVISDGGNVLPPKDVTLSH